MNKFIKGFVLFSSVLLALFLIGCDHRKNPNDTNGDKIVEVNLSGKESIKEVYTKNEIVALDDVYIDIVYGNGETNRIDVFNDDVTIEGIDTKTIGEKEIKITYLKDYVFYIPYTVSDLSVNLHFMDGTFEDSTEKVVYASNGEFYLGDIIPESNEFGYTFAGWFYDSELKNRVIYDLNGYLKANEELNLYAGYDVDYSQLYCYDIINNESCRINSINFEGDIFSLMDEKNLILPKTIELYPVTEISDYIFVKFDEDSGLSFSYNSFFSFESIEFPKDSYVTSIGKGAFTGITISKLVLPDSLKSIKESAFENCCELEEISIPENVEYIGNYAFSDCTKVTNIEFVDYGNLKTIGVKAFSSNLKLNNLVLPEGLEQIMPEAFSLCQGINSIYIPSSVNSIGTHAFQSINNLKEINVHEKNSYYCSIDGNLYSKDKTKFYQYCFGKFEESFTLPDSVESIEESAFNNMYGYSILKELHLSNRLKYIYDEAFSGMTFNLELPKSLTTLSPKAFSFYKGESIHVSDDNEMFTSDSQGILYSKDFKKLYCIPGNINLNVIYLDNRIEEIKSYSVTTLCNVKEIVISKDSNLKTIESYGLCLKAFEYFSGLIIEKQTPFILEENAFKDCGILVTNLYRVILPTEYYDSYYKAWENYSESMNEVNINDVLIAKSDLLEKTKDLLKNCNFTSFELYKKGVTPVLYGDISRDVYEIVRVLNFLSNIYESEFDTIDTETYNYYLAFEKESYRIVSHLFDKEIKLFTDFDIEILNIMLYHFQTLPNSFQVSLNKEFQELDEKMGGILEMQERRETLKKWIINYPYSTTSFSMADYQKIENEILETNLKRTILPAEITQYIDVLECSYLIYQFNRYKGDYIHHIKEVEQYLNSSIDKDGIYGILEYMQNVFSIYDFSTRIYGYDQFQSCYEEFLVEEEKYNNSILKEIQGFDLMLEYNEYTYKQMVDKILELTNNTLYDYEIATKKNRILVIYEMHMLQKNYSVITNENFNEAINKTYQIDGLLYAFENYPEINEEMDLLLQDYDTQKNNIMNFLNNNLNEFKNAIKGFDFTKEEFDIENYNKAVNCYISLGYNANMVDCFDIDDIGEYFSLFSIMQIYYDIYELSVIGKEGVNASNYNDIYKLLYGKYSLENNYYYFGIVDSFDCVYYSNMYELMESMYYYNTYITIQNDFNQFER